MKCYLLLVTEAKSKPMNLFQKSCYVAYYLGTEVESRTKNVFVKACNATYYLEIEAESQTKNIFVRSGVPYYLGTGG